MKFSVLTPPRVQLASMMVAGTFCVSAMQANAASSYAYTDLNTANGLSLVAEGINASGQVVGIVTPVSGIDEGFFTGANGSGLTITGTLGGSNGTDAYAINTSGQVAGSSHTTGNARTDPFVTGANGVGLTDISGLGGTAGFGWGVNDSGQVVGTAYLSGNLYLHAFFTGANGTGITDLGTLGGYNSWATGINASGRVVGYAQNASGTNRAFITGANGTGGLTDLGTLGGSSASAYAINVSGQVVGSSNLTGNSATHAFITGANGTGGLTDLGTLGGTNSYAYAVNTLGEVVGASDIVGNGTTHAFVTGANGVGMVDLNNFLDSSLTTAGWYLKSAVGINDAGQIVGVAYNSNTSAQDAFLLTPVPELDSLYAMGLGGLGLSALAWRRRKAP